MSPSHDPQSRCQGVDRGWIAGEFIRAALGVSAATVAGPSAFAVRADRLTATERAMLFTVRARAFVKFGRVQDTANAVGMADEEWSHTRRE